MPSATKLQNVTRPTTDCIRSYVSDCVRETSFIKRRSGVVELFSGSRVRFSPVTCIRKAVISCKIHFRLKDLKGIPNTRLKYWRHAILQALSRGSNYEGNKRLITCDTCRYPQDLCQVSSLDAAGRRNSFESRSWQNRWLRARLEFALRTTTAAASTSFRLHHKDFPINSRTECFEKQITWRCGGGECADWRVKVMRRKVSCSFHDSMKVGSEQSVGRKVITWLRHAESRNSWRNSINKTALEQEVIISGSNSALLRISRTTGVISSHQQTKGTSWRSFSSLLGENRRCTTIWIHWYPRFVIFFSIIGWIPGM